MLLKSIDISFNLPGMDKSVVSVPLQKTQAHYIVEDVLPQSFAYDLVRFQIVQCLLEVGGQGLDTHGFSLCWAEVIDIQIHRLSRIDAPLDSIQACRQYDRKGQVGIAGRIRRAELYTRG